jgi:hypothetical protein
MPARRHLAADRGGVAVLTSCRRRGRLVGKEKKGERLGGRLTKMGARTGEVEVDRALARGGRRLGVGGQVPRRRGARWQPLAGEALGGTGTRMLRTTGAPHGRRAPTPKLCGGAGQLRASVVGGSNRGEKERGSGGVGEEKWGGWLGGATWREG